VRRICTECGHGNSYKTYPDIDLKAGARGGRIALKAAQMGNIQKNLYGCYFDITLSDNSHFTGQILLLAQSPDAARASTNKWLRTKRPWRSYKDDIRTATAGGVESEELLTRFGFSVSLANS